MSDFYLDAQERANKSAVLIAAERYEEELAPFVKGSKIRFNYVSNELDKIAQECCEEFGANPDYVLSRLNVIIAEKLEGLPPARYETGEADYPNVHKTDVRDEGMVEGAGYDDLNDGVKQIDADTPIYDGLPSTDKSKVKQSDVVGQPGQQANMAWPAGAPCPNCKTPINQLTNGTTCPNCGANVQQAFHGGQPNTTPAQPTAPVQPAYASAEAGNLNDESTWKPCYRCGKGLNPVVAQVTPVCKSCTEELKKISEGINAWDDSSLSEPNSVVDYDENNGEFEKDAPFQCKLCAERGEEVKGSRDDILAHVREAHDAELNRSDQLSTQSAAMCGCACKDCVNDKHCKTFRCAERATLKGEQDAAKTGAGDVVNAPPATGDPKLDNPTPAVPGVEEMTPADRFDNMIQEIANRAAAKQFSMPDETEVHSIASQYGADRDQVHDRLFVTATFGDFTAANGDLEADANPPDGYSEVNAGNVGGRVEAHEALVPVNLVLSKVAEEMNMEPNLVYSMVRDKYGADLPDKYHASVSGEHHFYLPGEMVQNGPTTPDPSQQMPQQMPAPQAPQMPQQMPMQQPQMPMSSFKDMVELASREALARKLRTTV